MDMVDYLKCFIGIKYVYGGNTPEQGFDCSGLICEGLRFQGLIGKEDLSAQAIYERFKTLGLSSSLERNSLLFFGSEVKKITHIAIAIDTTRMLEAGGEGKTSTTEGFVRIRPVKWRGDLIAVMKL